MYIGSNAVDDIKIGASSVDAVYIGDNQVWSAIPADVKAHIARVIADGGTVPEQAKMVSMVKKLIAANLWNNCVFFGLPLGGVKKDGNEYVSNVYDLKANADLLQVTGTAQPKYQTDGSLLYDGGDFITSGNLSAGNPIYELESNVTLSITAKLGELGSQTLISRHAQYTSQQPFRFGIDATNRLFIIFRNGTNYIGLTSVQEINNIDRFCFCATFDGFISAVADRVKLYINGCEVNSTITYNGNLTSIAKYSVPIRIGNLFYNNLYPLSNGSQTSLHQIYNTTFTPEQMLWNFNNIRPEGI